MPDSEQTPPRVRLKGLTPETFQHPNDRQAVEKLKKMKGVDWLCSKLIEYGVFSVEYLS